jgi:hypothetical protein
LNLQRSFRAFLIYQKDLIFGAAAGNLARGVPLDARGNFSMAFFTDFKVRGYVGLLDWYTVSMRSSRLSCWRLMARPISC